MTGITRRTVIHGAAWSLPVIAAAVATPLAAASCPPEEAKPITCGGTPYDNGTYTIVGRTIVVNYRTVPDIYEINAKGAGWAKSYGTNFGTAPKRGALTWTVVLPYEPTKIQVHGFNAHLGENC
jgi:hypothetical protein